MTRAVLILLAWIAATPLLAQERFKSRNYRVRVAVQHEVEHLTLRGDGAYQIYDSKRRPLCRLDLGKIYHVQITRGRPAGLVWRLVLKEMDPHQVDEAIALAKSAKNRYNLPVKVIRYPARQNEEERLLVTMGEFDSVASARAATGKFPGEAIVHIYEERARAEHGQVRLTDAEGVKIAADEKFLRAVPLDMANSSLRVAHSVSIDRARHYRGEIELTMNEEGTLTAVNEVWVEYYLYSVVPAEIGGDAPLEAMKAQAVAARSEAIAKITRGIVSSSFFDFFDNAMAQVYRGKGDETPQSRMAVNATRGQLLVYNGEPVDAVYSHSCGGVIASAKDLWDGDGDPGEITKLDLLGQQSTPDLTRYEAARQFTARPAESLCNPNQSGFPKYARGTFQWTRTLTGAQLTRMMNASYGTGAVKDLIVDRRVGSGRVRKLRVVGEKKTVTISRELELRRAFDDLYSTFFTFDKTMDAEGHIASLTIHGAGFGHGVGLCQMGAYMMGKRGYNYRQILAHYYHGVRIRRLY